jgi:hypothetical protein
MFTANHSAAAAAAAAAAARDLQRKPACVEALHGVHIVQVGRPFRMACVVLSCWLRACAAAAAAVAVEHSVQAGLLYLLMLQYSLPIATLGHP